MQKNHCGLENIMLTEVLSKKLSKENPGSLGYKNGKEIFSDFQFYRLKKRNNSICVCGLQLPLAPNQTRQKLNNDY